MVHVSDAQMEAYLARVRSYVMVLLKVGPAYNAPDARPPEQAALVREHGRRNMALREEGKMAMVGPVHGARPIVGICIMTVEADEARAIMDADPAVRAGIFVYDLATWFGAPGDGLPNSQ